MTTTTAKPKRKNAVGRRLRATGFDLSTYDRSDGHYRVRCSQCEALVVNGVPIHEQGCPNERRS